MNQVRQNTKRGGLRLALACCLVAAALAVAPDGQAVPLDGVDELIRQQQRERVHREQQRKAPDVRLHDQGTGEAAEMLPDGETPCFTINRISLAGDAAGQFTWALAAATASGDPANGRCLGAAGINLVMKRIQNAIVERGYVTSRVLAEAQDLRSGTLVLTVIPGRIRNIRFAPGTDARATAWNALPVQPGDLLNLRDIEQALENFKRLPTADADIQIEPGDAPGESDVVITWRQAMPLRLTLAANDGGSKSTGKHLGSLTVSVDHLLALNDLFYVSFNRELGEFAGGGSGHGTRGHSVHYSFPWGYWLVALSASENRYHQTVAGISQNYRYSGTSENHEAKLSHLLHRDGKSKTTVSLRGYLTESANFIDDTEIEVQRRRMAGWEIGLQHRRFIAEATLDLSVAYRQGTGAFGALAAPEEKFDEGTHRPRVVSADANVNLPFRLAGETFRYTGSWRAQWNQTPLVPQDRFSIGGRYTIRGFDGESVLMAERGWLIRNDLAWSPGSGQELYLGLDHGEVGGRSAGLLVGRRLSGAVVGLRGGAGKFSWDLFTGWPLAKPDGFKSARNTSGFNLVWSF